MKRKRDTSIYIDPNLKTLIKKRLVFSLEHPDRFDPELLPKPNKYVMFGHPQSNKLEALEYLLEKNHVNYTVIDYGAKIKPQLKKLHSSVKVVIINNAVKPLEDHLFGKKDLIFFAVSDLPYNHLWKEWDFKLEYGAPDADFIQDLIKSKFETFLQSGVSQNTLKLELVDEDYEWLAKCCAQNSLEIDIDNFVRKVLYTAQFSKEQIVVNRQYLENLENHLLTIDQNGHDLKSISEVDMEERLKPYTQLVAPVVKRIKYKNTTDAEESFDFENENLFKKEAFDFSCNASLKN